MGKHNFSSLILGNCQIFWLIFFVFPKKIFQKRLFYVSNLSPACLTLDNIVNHYWEIQGNLSTRSCSQLRGKMCSGKLK